MEIIVWIDVRDSQGFCDFFFFLVTYVYFCMRQLINKQLQMTIEKRASPGPGVLTDGRGIMW